MITFVYPDPSLGQKKEVNRAIEPAALWRRAKLWNHMQASAPCVAVGPGAPSHAPEPGATTPIPGPLRAQDSEHQAQDQAPAKCSGSKCCQT